MPSSLTNSTASHPVRPKNGTLLSRISYAIRLLRARLGDQLRRHHGRKQLALGLPEIAGFFRRKLGYKGNFEAPKTYNEKLHWRKINVNPPDYARMTDKFEVRAYVDDVFGANLSPQLFPPLLGVYDAAQDISFDSLPSNCILKCTHGCQFNIFCREESPVDRDLAVKELRLWLTQTWKPHLGEQAYWHLTPRIIAEPLLRFSHGPSADDIKLFTFDGEPRLIQVVFGRFEDRKLVWLTPDWEMIDWMDQTDTPPDAPAHLAEMLDLARHISQGQDHLRVDYLYTDQDYWMNELTLYPSSGLRLFTPRSADRRLGDMWMLPTH